MRTVGVLDRTGAVLPVVSRVTTHGTDVVDLGSSVDLDPDAPRVDVLVLGPRELSDAGLRRVDRWKRSHPASAVVAVGATAGPMTWRLRAYGVGDVARGRPTADKVARLLDRAGARLELLAAELGHAAPAPAPDPVSDPVPAVAPTRRAQPEAAAEAEVETEGIDDVTAHRDTGDGLLITVASASGGCGKTFFATNLAAYLAQSGTRALLVDLDLQFGEVAPVLRVKHPYSLYDGLYGRDGRPLGAASLDDHLDELVYHHELGFDVLVAPREPSFADYVGARDAARVLDAVLPRYDVVIVDTPPSLNEVVLVALDRSDVVPVLATLDVPSLKNLKVFLDTLRRLRIDDGTVRLVLNKVEHDLGIDVAQAQEAFDGRFVGFIPTARSVSRSINSGQPIVRSEPRSPVAKALESAVWSTYPGRLERDVEETERRWSLRRLFAWRLSSSGGTA